MTIQGPLIAALIILSVAALLFAGRAFQLLYRDFRPKYRGRHRPRRPRTEDEIEPTEPLTEPLDA